MYVIVIPRKDNMDQVMKRTFDRVRVRTCGDKFERRIDNSTLGWVDVAFPKEQTASSYGLIRIKRGMSEAVDPFVGERKGERQGEPFGHHIYGSLMEQKRAGLERGDQRVYLIKAFLLF